MEKTSKSAPKIPKMAPGKGNARHLASKMQKSAPETSGTDLQDGDLA